MFVPYDLCERFIYSNVGLSFLIVSRFIHFQRQIVSREMAGVPPPPPSAVGAGFSSLPLPNDAVKQHGKFCSSPKSGE